MQSENFNKFPSRCSNGLVLAWFL